MKDIVVIAPTRDIYSTSEDIIASKRYDNVETVLGSMREGVQRALEAVEGGAKVLVTRGGTYRLCCAAVSLPIAEIKVSAYDIIQTLKHADIHDDVIGVVGYNNVVDGFDMLKELLPYDIVKIELTSEDQIQSAIRTYKKHGIRTFVGDANTTQLAAALGCDGIVISSQRESIYTAIREARRILRAIHMQKARTQQLEAITDFVHDGVIAIDENERVTVLNNTASEALRVDARAAIGRHILDVWPQSTLTEVMRSGRSELGRIESIYGSSVVASQIPIVIEGRINGAVETFMSVGELMDIERNVRRSMSRKGFSAKSRFADIVYKSDAMRRCVENARAFSKYDSPILITGEQGVGKELLAQAIHNSSPRRKGPFVAVSCAALPQAVMEGELFGRAESAHTGARGRQPKPGLIELAHGGTLFFNEVDELPPEIQGRLLQVMQAHEFSRADKVTPIDVRVICSTDKALPQLVEAGRFRRDLYYCLNVLSLSVPPLRDRREDIVELAAHYNETYSRQYGKPPLEMTEAVRQTLVSGRYDGNVRQLQSLIERCVILSSFESLGELGLRETPAPAPSPAPAAGEGELPDLRTMELRYIRQVYALTGGNTAKACAVLGIDRTTLWRKLKKNGGA